MARIGLACKFVYASLQLIVSSQRNDFLAASWVRHSVNGWIIGSRIVIVMAALYHILTKQYIGSRSFRSSR